MQIHGTIHSFPKEIKTLILVFLVILSIGYFTGLVFVNDTSSANPDSIQEHYLGNENDDNAQVMKFKKSEREMLTLVHNHILSLSLIFFVLALILSTTSINKKIKHFLMFEPLVSVVLTFGGIYLMWMGITWFKYIVMISGTLMTLSYISAVILIITQLFKKKLS
ncbi:hypothetical protein [Urechidicola croceus]|uniref:Uncharacterized protein n=1 Tax=Urechidicola croceus TaxID=1850246 RepID=A0A1D8P557_9FLAO|nr:hypothetical protein [Urechidicola croceus]AOW19651.1 hypothetical protein LPB138_02685 [Urechidicola croceus]